MGQKVHPTGFRLGFNKTWRSRWYAEKEYANLLHEDILLKKDLKKRFAHAGVSRVEVERAARARGLAAAAPPDASVSRPLPSATHTVRCVVRRRIW